jgi:hypothetical protein
MENNCKCCGRNLELRFGVCFDCADAESVIVEGVDMCDKEIPKIEGLSTSLSKLQYILKKFGITKNQ